MREKDSICKGESRFKAIPDHPAKKGEQGMAVERPRLEVYSDQNRFQVWGRKKKMQLGKELYVEGPKKRKGNHFASTHWTSSKKKKLSSGHNGVRAPIEDDQQATNKTGEAWGFRL